MAKVPLTPQQELEIGSAPQFSGTTVQPVQDTVTDDLVNFSKAQNAVSAIAFKLQDEYCLLYTSPSPRDVEESRMPSSA